MYVLQGHSHVLSNSIAHKPCFFMPYSTKLWQYKTAVQNFSGSVPNIYLVQTLETNPVYVLLECFRKIL